MKVAVYTLTLNKETLVKQWRDSCLEADYWLVADAGSCDGTVDAALFYGCAVECLDVSPWRYDRAKNIALNAIPRDTDYCVYLNVNETISIGWREELEKAHRDGISRPHSRIHGRHYYEWKKPVNEILVCSIEERIKKYDITICSPELEKPENYLSLLETSIKEDPNDNHNSLCFAEELFAIGEDKRAADQFRRCIELTTSSSQEKSKAMRYLSKLDLDNKEKWLLRACAESIDSYEAWEDLADYYDSIDNTAASIAARSRTNMLSVSTT